MGIVLEKRNTKLTLQTCVVKLLNTLASQSADSVVTYSSVVVIVQVMIVHLQCKPQRD